MVTTRPVDVNAYFDESTKSILGVPELQRRMTAANQQQLGQSMSADLAAKLRAASAANTARHSLYSSLADKDVVPPPGMLDQANRAALGGWQEGDRAKRAADINLERLRGGQKLPPNLSALPGEQLSTQHPLVPTTPLGVLESQASVPRQVTKGVTTDPHGLPQITTTTTQQGDPAQQAAQARIQQILANDPDHRKAVAPFQRALDDKYGANVAKALAVDEQFVYIEMNGVIHTARRTDVQ